jgi:hypothetical protein
MPQVKMALGFGTAARTIAGNALTLALGLLVIAQNNSKVPETISDPALQYCLFPMPREVRLIEVGLVVGLFLLLLPFVGRRANRLVLPALAGFVAVGVVGILMNPGDLSSQMQGLYLYAGPVVLFVVFTILRPTRAGLRTTAAIAGVWLLASVAVGLVGQLTRTRAVGDAIHGLFSDAHVFGSILSWVSVVAFWYFHETRRARWLAMSIVCLTLAWLPANEKMVLFNLVWLAVLFAYWQVSGNWKRRLITLILMASGLAAASLAYISFVQQYESSDQPLRLEAVSRLRWDQIGPVRAWVGALSTLTMDPEALLIGVGSGNYGGVAAGRAYLAAGGTVFSRRMVASLVTGEGVAGAFGSEVNTWANLVAEFGLLGSLCWAVAVIGVWQAVFRVRPLEFGHRLIRFVFVVGLSALIYQGMFTPYTNWGEPILCFPVMLTAAYCANRAGHRKASPSQPLDVSKRP